MRRFLRNALSAVAAFTAAIGLSANRFRKLVLGLTALVIGAPALAAPELDRSFEPSPISIFARVGNISGTTEFRVFQSSTAGLTGVLDSVDVYVGSGGTPTEDLVISIASVVEHWPKVFSPVWSEDQT